MLSDTASLLLASESTAMRLARLLGSERWAWALRRYHVPVPGNALVLEVGSGGNPYPRANVLLDAYAETRERHWAPLTADRPTVLGFVEKLPFKDKSFDFVIASHVLEHSAQPEKFLSELQRVARAGYIETPDAFMERINPYRDHRLEVTVRDGRLLIHKKAAWRVDDHLVERYEAAAKRPITRETIPSHPFDFHVRYYWAGSIAVAIENPAVDAGWEPPASNKSTPESGTARSGMRALLRKLLSQRARNRSLDVLPLLRCVVCGGEEVRHDHEAAIHCVSCGKSYPVRNGIPVMTGP